MQYKIIAAALISTFLLVNGCKNNDNSEKSKAAQEAPPQPPPALPVNVVTVKSESVPIWIEYTGKTEASQRVEVRARVSGKLEEVLFKEGEVVEKGQKLFVIEKTSYEAAVAQAKAKKERDEASLKLAQADVARYKPLVAEGLAPRVTLEQYQAQVAELIALIKSDQAALEDARLSLSYTDVLAPISGKISRKFIDVGNIVGYSEKTLLTTIVADDPMHAYFNPNEEQFQIIQKYSSKEILDARVTVPAVNEKLLGRDPFKGVVDFNDNRVDGMTGTITMRATVPNPDRKLLEGTFVYVDLFVTDEAKFLMVNPGIVQEDQRGSFLYVVDENNSAKRVDIVRGFETRNYLAIVKGLSGGEQVIYSGLARLRPGVKIKPTDVTDTEGVMAVMAKKDMVPEKE